MKPPLVVWGAGAIGGCIGAGLVHRGHEVVFVDHAQDHVLAMNEAGLQVTGPIEQFTVPVVAVQPGDLVGAYPLVFLCVKAHHTRGATRQLVRHLTPEGTVVSIQNGLCELEIAEIVGRERTVGAFVNFGADYLGPGVIHRGNRGAVVVGELDGQRSPRIEEIFRLLRTFEPDAVLTDNVFGYLWAKLAYAALLFATALTDASIADVLEAPRHRSLMKALAREVVEVAAARGVRLEGFDGFDPHAFSADAAPEAAARSLDDLVVFNRGSAKTHSGIWRDLAVRRRSTEVEAQLGAVVRAGREAGVQTPLLAVLIRQIHEIEAGAREQRWANLGELTASALAQQHSEPGGPDR